MAAIATFALKPGVWFRRVRLVIVSPDSQRTACLLSGRNSTYRPVQISGTSSILRAGTILDELSPTCLEQVRDYCSDYNRGRKGSFSEFKHAYIDMVVEHLNDARLRERRLFSAITGQEKDDLRDKW